MNTIDDVKNSEYTHKWKREKKKGWWSISANIFLLFYVDEENQFNFKNNLQWLIREWGERRREKKSHERTNAKLINYEIKSPREKKIKRHGSMGQTKPIEWIRKQNYLSSGLPRNVVRTCENHLIENNTNDLLMVWDWWEEKLSSNVISTSDI